MFVPIQQATWPTTGEVRELRFSVNAPVLLGPGGAAQPTRAALGWLPDGPGAVVRLWLRSHDGREVRGFDLPGRPPGPSARAAVLERAERFLGGLGFLFAPARAPETSRTSDPGPGPDPDAAPHGAAVATAARADVRFPLFCRSGPWARAASRATGPRGGVE